MHYANMINTPTAAGRPVSVILLARNGYSYAPFIAKPKAACGLCFDQLGGHVQLL